jgi:uncharacterized protein (TIGR04255 family)
MPERTLPDYEQPPVVETALAVRFVRLEGWNVLHFGKLTQAYKDWYPKSEPRPSGGVEVSINPQGGRLDIPIRLALIDGSDSQLVQVQNDLFMRNWRKTHPSSEYTHYEQVKPLFFRDWKIFCEFLIEQGLPTPKVWQCEVTYINHVVRGEEWETPKDFHRLFKIWNKSSLEMPLESPEAAYFAVSYALQNGGRLQFSGQPAVRLADSREVFQLIITATGQPKDSSPENLELWLDQGRAAVVEGFTAFTTNEAQKIWRRIN